jgi:hypothetical protein
MNNRDNRDNRDILEDHFIKETGQFAFVDPNVLNPKYIEWIESKLVNDLPKRTKEEMVDNMKVKHLMKPRFEVMQNYPMQIKEIGDVFETNDNRLHYIVDQTKLDVREYPHLFRKLNWWEYRKKEDMPKKIMSMAFKDNPIQESPIHEILEWDMNSMVGYVNIEKTQVCDLKAFAPEYGYFPAV